jgi:N-acetylglutamate synthase-like GNAT family acetyltransferase
MSAKDLFVSDDPRLLDVDMIHGFLSTVYWSEGLNRGRLERSIQNSMNFGVYERQQDGERGRPRQIGYARVVTDKASFAYLCDVFVLENHRRRGAGKKLLEDLFAHPDLQSLRRFALITRDAHKLYAQFGFKNAPDPTRYMERIDVDACRRSLL